jgi:cytochrome P450
VANALVGWNDPDVLDGREPLQMLFENIVELTSFSMSLAAERRAAPADDLLSALVSAEVDGQRLTDDEIGAFFVLLSVAGNDTTRHTISHTMVALSEFREQRALLLEDFEGRIESAVEEMIRWATPVMTFRRTALSDTSLGGQEIAAGDKVVMFYSSANRDEAVFDDPWQFDITRDPNRHVGFGGGGPHYCLGASLARTQLRAIFGELLRRIPDLEVGAPQYLVGNFIHGIRRLPFHFERVAQPAVSTI